MKPRICIVGGCGRTGLPLGIRLALAGANVVLLDRNVDRVAAVTAGELPFLEAHAQEPLRAVLREGSLKATCSSHVLSEQEAVILAVGVSLDELLNPDLTAFHALCDGVLSQLSDGQLFVLRGTVFPGTTERVAQWAARQHRKICVAYCPQRTAQGHALADLRRHPQIVAGATPLAAARAGRLFALLDVPVVELPPLEAELSKLFVNAYRYINFAAANQLYLIAERFGADYQRICEAMTRDYPRLSGLARAGLAAGPGLPLDTVQLAAFDWSGFPLGQAALAINEGLPAALVAQAKIRHDLSGMVAGVLGMAFKAESDDARGSLAYKLAKLLRLECRDVLCTDPHVDDASLVPLDRVLDESDILFVGACHAEYRDLAFTQPVVDCFGFLRTSDASRRARRAA